MNSLAEKYAAQGLPKRWRIMLEELAKEEKE